MPKSHTYRTQIFSPTCKRKTINRPFYSCVLSYLAMNASEAGGDLVFDTDLSAFLMEMPGS